jgi:hypothetical protein
MFFKGHTSVWWYTLVRSKIRYIFRPWEEEEKREGKERERRRI